jgi:hypothetical protein
MPYPINTTTWRSPNYSTRNGAIGSIVIHSCEGRWPFPRQSSLPWLCNPASKVSSHYYVCRNVEIFQLVADEHEAWHAGEAQTPYVNDRSIGVELEHRSGQDWPDAQIDALTWLVTQIMSLHHIPSERVETHGQIAIKGPYSRKIDPTNWPYKDFLKWRKTLGAVLPDPFAGWGPIGKPEGLAQGFAVPKAWLAHAQLGRCVTPEHYAPSGSHSVTEFEGGIIIYLRGRDVALVESFVL